MEQITIDDFKRAKMVIGEILSAEKLEGADKLLVLKVDVGEEAPRQILSGIALYFPEPAVLVGRKCAFVVNLLPRMLRGLESNGMIMAAHDENSFSLLLVDQKLAPGTPIS